MLRRPALPALFLTSILILAAAPAAADPVINHDAIVRFDLEAHRVEIVDRMVLPPHLETLEVGAGMEILTGSVQPHVTLLADDDGSRQVIDLAALGLAAGGELELRLAGTFHQPTGQVTFSRENVGGEITATVGEEGIYLSGSAGWLPWHPTTLAIHRLEVHAPEGFVSVTQGRRVQPAETGGNVTHWVADHPADGINLVANRFIVHEEPVREGVTAYTFLLEDDERLRARYMERTHAYLAMYEEMFGPYPFAKFATVENWFPTGYGMPSWTLLGGQVLRLPFIPYTSFGHEIAHNWWGNGVLVDVSGGNWCEGLTVWCADYHYKELESPEAAREYRRNTLKDYHAYVSDPENDFPLREFESRHSGATRAVGYGKSLMVFHMLDRKMGREPFLAGLRRVATDFMFRQASWDDFLDAFAEAGDESLDQFATEWLDRAGAPRIALSRTEFKDDEVRFTLVQDTPVYRLEIPVAVTTAAGEVRETVVLEEGTGQFTVKADGPRRLVVDPDYDVFRRLHPREVEPTVSQVLAEEEVSLVVGGSDEAEIAEARAFAVAWTDSGYFDTYTGGRIPMDMRPGRYRSNVVVNPAGENAELWRRPEVAVAGKTLVLEGKRYDLGKWDLVYTTGHPFDGGVTDLVIHTADPRRLPGLARRLGHYGKYSWLLLPAGSGRPLRGNWHPEGSPLAAESP